MAESVDETVAVEAAQTAVALDLAPTQAAELAWSEAEPAEVELPRSWRPAIRAAVGVFATCVAVAGGITAVDRHWFSELRASIPAPVAAPSSVAAAPAEVVTQPSVWTLPPVPAAEHLQAPEPPAVAPDTYTDAAFIAALSRNGVSVYDPQSTVLLARMACSELQAGRSVASVASELKAGQNSSSRAPIDMPTAMAFVAASVNYYCPQFR